MRHSHFNGTTFADGDAPGNVFTFADGGVFIPAGTGIFAEAGGPAGSSVGITSITVETVPEPTSTALIGLTTVCVGLRRRRRA